MKKDLDISKPYSETYWNLHRNSLISSILLLLISAPDSKIGNQIIFNWITLENKSISLLTFGIFIFAIYCFMAFYFEWWKEARSSFHSEGADRAAFRSIVNRLIDEIEKLRTEMSQYVENIQSKYENETNTYRKLIISDIMPKKIKDNNINIEIDQIKNNSKTQLDTIMKQNVYTLIANTPISIEDPMTINSLIHRINSILFEYVDQIVEQSSRRAFDIGYSNIDFEKLDRVSTISQNSLIEVLKQNSDDIVKASNKLDSKNFGIEGIIEQISRESYMLFIRAYIVGVGFPAILFGVSFMHYIGKFHCVVFSSWIF